MISVRADAPKDLDRHKDTIRTLMDAIGEERRIRMDYFSVHSQKKKHYVVDPYRLMYFRAASIFSVLSRSTNRSERSLSSGSRTSRTGDHL